MTYKDYDLASLSYIALGFKQVGGRLDPEINEIKTGEDDLCINVKIF